MFKVFSLTGLGFTVAVVLIHYLVFHPKSDALFGSGRKNKLMDILRYPVFLFTLLFPERKHSFLGIVKKILYLLALLCGVILFVTGFYPRLVLDETIGGYFMMVHSTAAPIFAVCVAFLGLFWAHQNRFKWADWPWLRKFMSHFVDMSKENTESKQEIFCLGAKICFWAILSVAIVVILSIIASMFKLFGTEGQEILMVMHRYGGLLLVMFGILHFYLLILAKMKHDSQA